MRDESDDEDKATDFAVVGVGASAGGLDAYKKLLTALPVDLGAAFILIQHLDPHHESLMVDLLARHTRMRVVQAEDAMPLEPDVVYMIPPGKFIRLIDHHLYLDQPVGSDVVRLSIDYFFRSLAEVRGEKSIGIVLSGTGSDGTLGIREIKAAGGMVLVQDPAEAEYDGMPRSAVHTGLVDHVLPIAEMPDALAQFLRHPYVDGPRIDGGLAGSDPDGFRAILKQLHQQTGYDFRSYKMGTVERRIQRRMGLKQVDSLESYARLLRGNPEEVTRLFRDLLIGVTRFFREPEAWAALGDHVLKPLARTKSDGASIRAWVPGCATGEEAYTLAISIHEQLGALANRVQVQIFATDLNDKAIEFGRAGRYASSIAADVPQAILKKYFIAEEDGYRVVKKLRETVVFATQNLISDPPFSKLDIITCRNLMIYLQPDVQQRAIEMFHFALSNPGYLFLGSSETADRPRRLFEPLDRQNRIYRRRDAVRSGNGMFPVGASKRRDRDRRQAEAPARGVVSVADAARETLLDRFSPPAVFINFDHEVLYYQGAVRRYLDFPTGTPSASIFDIVIEPLQRKLRTLVNGISPLSDGPAEREVVVRNIRLDGRTASVTIRAERIDRLQRSEAGILIWFEDDADKRPESETSEQSDPSPAEMGQIEALEYELKSTREDLQSIIEEMETANEELKASNEEVMSMNEEFQSTNEELETSREELQSLNEELSTVNSQLEDKIGELETTANDLDNLLISTNIGVVFLDTDMVIRRFTPAIKQIMRMIDGDIGRPVDDIAMRVSDETLLEDARACLASLSESEAEVVADDGRALIRRLRPFRTSENRIDGVVVTYTDVTSLRDARDQARTREKQQGAVAELGRMALAAAPVEEMKAAAVRMVGERLNVRFVKILELQPGGHQFLLTHGIGWKEGLEGTALVDADSDSQAGYTLHRGGPVIVEDTAEEQRFLIPPILKDHDILCGASVPIGPGQRASGVLGVHETEKGRCTFTIDDVNFMQSVANVLWLASTGADLHARIDEERRQLREMTDALPLLFAVIDRDKRYELANGSFQRFDIGPQQIVGQKFGALMGPEAARVAEPHLDRALAGEVQEYRVETAFGGGGPRDFLVTLAPRKATDGTVTGVFAATLDISDQVAAQRERLRLAAIYETIGATIPYGIWITDAQGALLHISDAFLELIGMTLEEAKDFGWTRSAAHTDADAMLAEFLAVIKEEGNWEKEFAIRGADGVERFVLTIGRPVRDSEGSVVSWVGLNLDITRRKHEQKRLETIMAELDHRVKNALATVSTIARMTARGATSVDEYRTGLEARITSLSSAHRLLADAKWTGMSLEVLLRRELAPYDSGWKIDLRGDPVHLGPSAAQSFALAFHELTTNAAKYGAFSREGGTLEVAWEPCDMDGQEAICLTWTEHTPGGIAPPTGTGFGTTVIRNVLVSQLRAEAQIDYPPEGLTVDLKIPRSTLVQTADEATHDV